MSEHTSWNQEESASVILTVQGTVVVGSAGVGIGISCLPACLANELSIVLDQEVLSLIVVVDDGQNDRKFIVGGDGQGSLSIGVLSSSGRWQISRLPILHLISHARAVASRTTRELVAEKACIAVVDICLAGLYRTSSLKVAAHAGLAGVCVAEAIKAVAGIAKCILVVQSRALWP